METAAGRGQIHLDLPRNVILAPPPLAATLDHAEPIWEVPLRMTADVHPPLYFVLLRLWQNVFGGGDAASRSLSVAAGVAAVFLIFDAGRWLADPTTGLWAALLMAVAQPEIVYSQDARPYALVAALALGAMAALARIERLGPNSRRLMALAGCLVGACLTHYFVLPAVMAMAIYALVRLRVSRARPCVRKNEFTSSPGTPGEDRGGGSERGSLEGGIVLSAATAQPPPNPPPEYRGRAKSRPDAPYELTKQSAHSNPALRQVFVAFAVAGLIVLFLWGGGMWVQRKNFSDPWMYWFNDVAPHHVAATFQRFAALPLRYLAEPPAGSAAVGAGAAVLFLLPWLRCGKNGALLLPAMWLLGCAALIGALDLRRGTNQLLWIKYSLLAGPAEYLLLPMLFPKGWLKHLLAGAAVLYCLLGLPEAYDNTKANFKGLAAKWDSLAGNPETRSEPLLFTGVDWGDWYTGGLYMALERYAHHPPPAVVLLKGPATAQLYTQLNTPRCGLITAWTSVPPNKVAPGWQVENAFRYPEAAVLYQLTIPRPVSRE